MNVVRYTDADFTAKLEKLLSSSNLFDSVIEQRTREIIEAVQLRHRRYFLSIGCDIANACWPTLVGNCRAATLDGQHALAYAC